MQQYLHGLQHDLVFIIIYTNCFAS